jgi:hypothetical protein
MSGACCAGRTEDAMQRHRHLDNLSRVRIEIDAPGKEVPLHGSRVRPIGRHHVQE